MHATMIAAPQPLNLAGRVAVPSSEFVLRLSGGASDGPPSALHPVLPFLILNTVVVLWASDECLIKHMLDTGKARSPAFLNASRFLVAALAFLPWWPGAPFRSRARELWGCGSELGLCMFAGFSTQAIGLQYTSAARSAFLLYMNVVLVPVFGSAFFGRSVHWGAWIKAFAVLAGTVLLSHDNRAPNVGDAWCLCASVSSAVFILRLEKAAQRFDAAQLQCACMCTVAGICALWLAAAEGFSLAKPSRSEMGVALYLGLVPTALCSLLQTIGQRNIPAEAASIIYALDPVYTAILGAFFLGETLGTKGMLGGGLVFVSSLLNFEASRAPHEHVS